MLVRMGWNEGSGLGKEEQGQINPVSVLLGTKLYKCCVSFYLLLLILWIIFDLV